MGVITFLVFKLFHLLTRSNIISLLPALIAAVCVYFVLILKNTVLTRDELYDFPFGMKMYVVADKLHLLADEEA